MPATQAQRNAWGYVPQPGDPEYTGPAGAAGSMTNAQGLQSRLPSMGSGYASDLASRSPLQGGGVKGIYDAAMSGTEQRANAAGYAYDPVTHDFQRTPQSAGQRAGQEKASYIDSVPSLKALSDSGIGLAQQTPNLISGLNASMGGGGFGGFGGGGGGSFGGGGGPNLPPRTLGGGGGGTGGGGGSYGGGPQMPDMSGADASIFARAKDQVGQTSRASLSALSDEMSGQGMSGSGAQAQGTTDVINKGQGELGQVSRDLATTRAGQALDLAKTGYEGGITMRGQDVGAGTAQRGQDIGAQVAYRGQDVGAMEAQARLALENRQQLFSALGLMLGGLGGGSSRTGQLY